MHDHPLPAPADVRPLLGALTALLVVLGTLLPAGPAVAHDQLLASDPADGAVLEQAPAAVVLTFNADQLPVGAAVVVRDPSGADRADGAPSVSGPTVTQVLQAGLPAGSYAVQWRSVSGDGHPIEGAFSFEVAGDAAPPTQGTDASAGTDAADAGDPAAAAVDPGAEGTADGARPTDPGAQATGASGLVPWAVGLVVALAAVGGVVLARRRSRTADAEGTR